MTVMPRNRFITKRPAHGIEWETDLSPSAIHRHVLDLLEPKSTFTGTDVSQWQIDCRELLKDLLGFRSIEPVDRKGILWESEDGLGQYSKEIFIAPGGALIPVYRCQPQGMVTPKGWIICLQGHTTGMHLSLGLDREERFRLRPSGDRDFVKWCLELGYGAYCMEIRSLGARVEQRQ